MSEIMTRSFILISSFDYNSKVLCEIPVVGVGRREAEEVRRRFFLHQIYFLAFSSLSTVAFSFVFSNLQTGFLI